ncbi:hypothetical protein GCM10010214_42430 [Streptomyces abikoensis]|nr:hypothetical protein GCM10010214_42430 [Streptomyces abikoensis]
MTTRAAAIQISVVTPGHVTVRLPCGGPAAVGGLHPGVEDGVEAAIGKPALAPIRLHPSGF